MFSRLLALLVVTGGCDYIFRLDEIPAASDTADGMMGACEQAVISDAFDTGGTACASWGTPYNNNGAVLTHGNGSLIATPSLSVSDAGCYTPGNVQFDQIGLFVEVRDAVAAANGYTQLQVVGANGTSLGITVTNGSLQVGGKDGVPLYNTAAYSPTVMHWWRIRANAARTAVLAEYSEDGHAWVLFHEQLDPVPSTARVELNVGTNGTNFTAPGSAVFAHFGRCP